MKHANKNEKGRSVSLSGNERLFREESLSHAGRAGYLIGRMTAVQPVKPVVVITSFPNFCTYEIKETISGSNEIKYNDILRRIVKDARHPNLYLAEGADILTEFSGLTADLIHPSDAGHVLMGENLAHFLLEILET